MHYLAPKWKFTGAAVTAGAVLITALTVGCNHDDMQTQATGTTKDQLDSATRIKVARAKLSAEDLKLVEAQEYCPIQARQRLGSKGQPIQQTLENQRIFLCCEECVKTAKADPTKTLEMVAELKEVQATRAKLNPDEKKLVEAQDYCAVMDDSRLGAMGEPIKIMIQDQPVYLCCKGCQKKALANSEKTLAKAKELKAQAQNAH